MEQKNLKEIIMNDEFCKWADLRLWNFRFPVYQGYEYMNADIEVLDLSVRSYNCLKRAGFSTINDMISAISGRNDLNKIRNLGKKSAEEIMVHLFLYQYSNLKDHKKNIYLNKIISIN